MRFAARIDQKLERAFYVSFQQKMLIETAIERTNFRELAVQRAGC